MRRNDNYYNKKLKIVQKFVYTNNHKKKEGLVNALMRRILI